jgi:hypothetical protein
MYGQACFTSVIILSDRVLICDANTKRNAFIYVSSAKKPINLSRKSGYQPDDNSLLLVEALVGAKSEGPISVLSMAYTNGPNL